MEGVFQGGTLLPRTISWGSRNVDLGAVVLIEALDEFRPGNLFNPRKRSKRYLTTICAPNVEFTDIANVCALFSFRFYICLPLSAEAIKVIDKIPPHEGLHGRVDGIQIHLLLQGLIAI